MTSGPHDLTDPVASVRHALADAYEVVREVGRGGMATVYLARARSDGQEVAIKVLNPDLAGSVGSERFVREIGIASKLDHPGILSLLDSGTRHGVTYYVMPFVRGESLRDRLHREGPLPIAEAVQLTLEVCHALDYAHARGVIHRDIKPDNILLSDGKAVVSDFGIARAVDQAGSEKLTETGLAVGTPTYMSPEMWMGERVDGRSDVYALACVLFEMLIGEPPFSGPSPQVIMARHSMEAVPSMRVARATIPPALEEAVRQALAKTPADRFQSAAAFAGALRSASSQSAEEPVRPANVTPQAPVVTRAVRSRRAMVGILAGLLAIAAIGGGYWWRRSTTPADDGRTRLVVLPFRNIGEASDEYFSDGITEEITSRLSGVSALAVIARTSANQYRNAEKSVTEIGQELDVRYVLEGSVRWDRSSTGRPGVRISIALINTEDGTQKWQNTFSFNIAEVFAVQANVAEAVIKALDLAMFEPERQRLTARPTDNFTAYDYLLRGNSYYNRSWARADVDSAIIMYEKATQADPKFALAWAQLGKAHAWMHRLDFDATDERLRLSRAAIDQALALDPELPETHIAQGLYHYWGRWEFEQAIDELTKARTLQPSNAWVHLQMGNIRRRQGLWAEAVRNYEEAGKYDPRFHVIWFNIGHLRLHVRQLDQAEPYLDRAIALQPAFLDAQLLRASLYLHRDNNIAAARRMLDSTIAAIPPASWRPLATYWINGAMRTYKPADERLRLAVAGTFGLDSNTAMLARAEALLDLARVREGRVTLDSAITALEAAAARTPKVDWLPAVLSIAYAYAGRKDDAVAAARRARTLQPDALDGPSWIANEARVRLMTGDTTAALALLATVLSIPSGTSVNGIKADPSWAGLRDHPGLRAVLAKGSPPPPQF